MYFDGQWGTISTLELDEHVPSVICRQLGFQGEAKGETPEDAIGPISSPVWKFTCSEGVSSVLECDRIKNQPISDPSYADYSIVDFNNWDHNNDLGVVCEGERLTTMTMMTDSDDICDDYDDVSCNADEPSTVNYCMFCSGLVIPWLYLY